VDLFIVDDVWDMWTQFGIANGGSDEGIVTGWRGGEATPPRRDLNLGSGETCFFETLAEVDFNSYRPRDLTHRGQSSGEPF